MNIKIKIIDKPTRIEQIINIRHNKAGDFFNLLIFDGKNVESISFKNIRLFDSLLKILQMLFDNNFVDLNICNIPTLVKDIKSNVYEPKNESLEVNYTFFAS